MKTMFRLLPAALVASLLTASAARAHHSFAMFDRSVEKVVTGTVVRWAVQQPAFVALPERQEHGRQRNTLELRRFGAARRCSSAASPAARSSPATPSRFSYCPLKDGRPGGGLGWARLANGTFVNPADGGCDGSAEAIERWKVWLAKGYTSSTEAQKAK